MGKLNVDTGSITEVVDAKELAELRRDAARYRWLRWGRRELPDGGAMLSPPDLDAAIDAAMNGANA